MQYHHAAGALALMALAGCMGTPDMGASMSGGVGFGDYQRYLREREAAAAPQTPLVSHPRGSVFSNPPDPLAATLPARPLPQAQPAPLAAPMVAQTPLAPQPIAPQPFAPVAPVAQTPQRTAALPTTSMGTLAPAAPTFGTTPAFDAGPSLHPGISNEQDFDTVAARETIESDRERLAQQRAQYQVVRVDSVPTGTASSGPNLVAYALGTSHPLGTRVHSRLNPLRWQRSEQACLQFRNQDAAQEAFLTRGGPQRDPDHLDPDGDGYACWWDPTPFRQVARAGQ